MNKCSLIAQELSKPIYDLSTQTDAGLLARLLNIPGQLGEIESVEAVRHDFRMGVRRVLQDILDEVKIIEVNEVTKAAEDTAIAFMKLINAMLPTVNVAGPEVQQGLDFLVWYKGAENGYTLTMREDLERIATSEPPFVDINEADIAIARLMKSTSATVINYTGALEHHAMQYGRKVKIFVYLAQPAPEQLAFDIVALERSAPGRAFVNNKGRCAYIHMKKGAIGGHEILNQTFTDDVKFDVVCNFDVAFSVDVINA